MSGGVLLPGDLEGKSGDKVPQRIILMGHCATLKKLHVPLSNLHEPGHLEDLVPVLFSCPMPTLPNMELLDNSTDPSSLPLSIKTVSSAIGQAP